MRHSARVRLRALIPALVLLSLGAACGGAPPTSDGLLLREPPERIVLIVIDTLRRDRLSCYGGQMRTPNIDALAAQGQRFEAAFASFHQTTMSMASLFTGRTPSLESGDFESALPWNGRNWCGLRRFGIEADSDACLPARLPTLAEQLRAAGYWTIGISSNALLFTPAGFDRGFERWIEVGAGPDAPPIENVEGRAAGAVNAAAVAALRSRPSDRFFLYVHYMDVHDYQPASELARLRTGKPLRNPYAKGIASTDRALGSLLDQLAELGLANDTVVFLTSDHGERLGEVHLVGGRGSHDGNPSFEELLRVPLIVSPAVFADSTRLTRGEDLHHMILRLAGAPVERDTELTPDELFTSESAFQTYRQSRFKSYRDRESGTFRLVDLDEDPGETRDVAALHPEVAAAHRERMEELTRALAAVDAEPSELTEDDRTRLRALGYLE